MGSNDEKGVRSLQKVVENQWRRSVEYAQAQPYDFYALAWIGASIYAVYKWRKFRQMEDKELRRMQDGYRSMQHRVNQFLEAHQARIRSMQHKVDRVVESHKGVVEKHEALIKRLTSSRKPKQV